MATTSSDLAGRGVDAVVIGASAGGLEALLAILAHLPSGYRLPLLAVLHLPSHGDSRLAEVLGARMHLPVREAADKERVEPGTLYVAPGGYHVLVERDLSLSLSCDPPVHYSRPSIDVMMESAADAWGERLAGVLLTGANDDGADGLARIGEHGGLTIVQDPREAAVSTMPQAAIARRQPDHVLGLAGIHALLLELDKH
ncbi:chemotaxis protein CheB|uniref:chemotaxis protein CheB n=1 Tax=Noviherbaspirillum sp. L7-7A TaxID=2850560 RepID=UPI001C2C6397|nr:chemotaxis protein CheB [Noviherbaspirillum sp. L7-7A]MBV0878974.1 chemotaxis protein CheB [Noviherbaspirillum sp. L7-7A]